MTVREIKKEALDRFAVNRYQAMILYCAIFAVVLSLAVTITLIALISNTINTVLSIILWWYGIIVFLLLFLANGPLQYSLTSFYLTSYRGVKVSARSIFEGFNKNNLERVIVLLLIRTGITLALGILLIVPGVIYSIRTSMSFYILRANPKMKPSQALAASNKVMTGHSGQYFHLGISFILWFLIGLVSFGLGFIWLSPFYNSSKVVFYKRVLEGDTTEYDEEGESVDESIDDDKNIATKLMKLQLTNEISDLDKKIKVKKETISHSNSRSNEKKAAPLNFIPSTGELSEVHNEPKEVTLDDLKLQAEEDNAFNAEIANVNKLINEDSIDEIKEVALPLVHTKDIEKTKQINRSVDSIPVTKTTVEIPSTKANSRDEIRQKIETLRQERLSRMNIKQAADKATQQVQNSSKPIYKSKEISVSFEPEKIDIETIDED